MSEVVSGRTYFSVPPPPPQMNNISSRFCLQTSPVTGTYPEDDSRSLGNKAYDSIVKCNSKQWATDVGPPCLSFGHCVDGVLQKGPQCGFAALIMAAHIWKKDDLTLDLLVKIGKQKGYTIQGELFSAYFMEDLAQEFCSAQVVDSANLCPNVIWECLLQGYLLLVPYDSDKNYHPCLQNGHKAHWALLTGCFLVLKESAEIFLNKYFERDSNVPRLFHAEVDGPVDGVLSKKLLGYMENAFVYTMQGKSRRPGVWSLKDLIASNQNLFKVSPGRNNETYVIPPNGIENELCGKIVILKPN